MSEQKTQPPRLESHVLGRWMAGKGEGQALLDASTGETVALIDASGIDFADVLNYGRKVGSPALRAMSFHQRAMMLKALGEALMADKEMFYELSARTGATRTDSWIDIEGGIGTLMTYASKGRRELPNTRVLVDGGLERLSRDGTFSAQHILSPLQGVAIHINAFNFPCWGMLEKLAPTWLAGMAAIVKPASQTAYLTELMVRRMLATGLLPEGALQLICGSVGDLLSYVDGQDVVTFTGSASTGQKLRSSPSIVQNSVRFNMEADSLNAAVLGTDVTPEEPEFKLFVREVVREMTVKAGQKCTAIRRIMVPRAMVEPVIAAIRESLARVVVGNPADPSVTMGALASLGQREEVRARIAELKAESSVVVGEPDRQDGFVGDAGKGAFFSPVLLHCEQPLKATRVHQVEAFGPVSTIMPYDSTEEAVELVCRGEGSLVASLFTNDPAVAEAFVLGIAPFHGRVMLGNRASARSATGHGSPMPGVVHGGPGRAGGGEELGGIRSVMHYMQRTGVQGAPALLGAVMGRWVAGAPARQDERHPFRKSLAELKVGDQLVTAKRTVSLADIEHFAEFTGDTFYAHMDEEAARANPFFDGRVAHGYLIVSFAAGLFVDPAPGPVLANYGVDNLRFMTPVYAGDTLGVQLTCKEINPRANAEHGEVRWDCVVTNQRDEVVAHYDVLTMVAKTWG
ncbi:MAG: phenylacetic acid degradation bifunctional protein PaaZ [Lautropia sp.]|nr:phenylacetic acid degradation bifunctional protein PaaZ [Lautropia sp.]